MQIAFENARGVTPRAPVALSQGNKKDLQLILQASDVKTAHYVRRALILKVE